jgi:GTPase SAR1 family protein
MADNIITWKIMFLGPKGAGKTSLINRIVYDIFADAPKKFDKGEFFQKKMDCETADGKVFLTLLISEQDSDNLYLQKLKNTKVGLIVTDVTNLESLHAAEEMADKIIKTVGNINLVFLGNKSDSKYHSLFWEDDLKVLANKFNATYAIVSAKNGDNILNTLKWICESIYNKESRKILA